MKGTRFWVMVAAGGQTKIICLEGLLRLLCRATGEEKNLAAGNTAEIDKSGITITSGTEVPGGPETGSRMLEIELEGADGAKRKLQLEFEEK